ncbi:hypothetical protein Slala05_21750 [Streptomyces lavendulae subsp. lavendulae]|nr:hypothetical protein Slala05_21750 [Streptomyces lavendulae subsp. lavendulae]
MSRRLSPESARERMISYGMTPTEPYPGSVDEPWPGTCSRCGTPGKPTLSNAKRQGPCTPCGREKQAAALRLPLADVVRALEAKGLIVIGDYQSNRERIESICLRCGALVYPTYSNAMREGVGVCDQQCKRDRISDSNRGDAQEAVAVLHANNLLPLAPYPGTDTRWPMECMLCGHVGEKTTLSAVRQLGHVCARCGRERTTNARRLDALVAVQSMRDALLEPDAPYPGTVSVPWACTCMNCGTQLRPGPRLNDVRNGDQGGCTTCSDTSFKQTEPAHVYLVVNPQTHFIKWGKANNLQNRLAEHARQGFDQEVKWWPFPTGAEATEVEKKIRPRVRAVGATTQADRRLMRYKGHTETASLTEISIDEVITIVEHLISQAGSALDMASTISRTGSIPSPQAGLSNQTVQLGLW